MNRRTGLLFVTPALALFGVFVLYPMVTSFSYAFYGWAGTARQGFVGLENFTALFTRAPFTTDLPRALWHNVLFFVGTMLVQNTIGLTVAFLLHRRARTRRALQTLYAMPYLVSPIVIGYLWTLLLSPTFGPVNTLLTKVGLESWALPWLGDPDTALWVVILVSVWQWIGFPVLLYGAALGGVPDELTEAARVDGASNGQAFRRVVLPLLVPAIGTVSVLTFIFAMEAFALPYAFGGSTGNPAGSTDFLSLLFYRTAFDSGSTDAIGTSSALATLLFLLIFGGAFGATAVLRRHEKGITG
ncbi:sugar ABC transporter permease [Phycicoccus sp. MAQZ13P-2]|uniref:carbohydrate ABC transporter permease n=1 Tax=Phycicoccus TaxID=367298 RepID=UPI00055E3D50|nr:MULTISPECIES: sugar ABC transporter permease [Phycicoccus]MBT9256767.1 sugar ABC transporter permease [Phycicoccus mangrovi]MBT9274669.1 sugar ABC transporter permease [Phycicoccus mangrovi]GIL35159.1 sugar ABC transporter permease [Phycicoccus sp. DTK01]